MGSLVPRQSVGAWCFRATFAPGHGVREYISPDVRIANPGWGDEIFKRQIESFEFFLPTGHKIVLSGMEQYNFWVEATQSFTRGGGARIEAFWFAGKLPGQPVVECWRVADGKVVRARKPWGQEWAGTATRGWKTGVVGAEIQSAIIGG